MRQTDGVTPQSPQAWLGATGSWAPPRHGCPPTIVTPIRFLPIKQPVFLPVRLSQQWSLGKGVGMASRGRVPRKHGRGVNETCVPGGDQGWGGARAASWALSLQSAKSVSKRTWNLKNCSPGQGPGGPAAGANAKALGSGSSQEWHREAGGPALRTHLPAPVGIAREAQGVLALGTARPRS